MQKEKSLVKHILKNVFLVTIVIVSVVLVVSWMIMISGYIQKTRSDVKSSLSHKAEEMRLDFEKQIYKSDHVIGNINIIEKLDEDYDDGYKLMSFVNEINTFMDALEQVENNNHERILIYSTNPTLIESRYIRNISRLPRSKSRLRYFQNSNENYYWDETIYKDSSKREYLVLLRYLPLDKECVMEMKLYFDSVIENNNYVESCSLLKKSQITENSSLSVIEIVFEDYYLKADIPKSMIVHQGLIYLLYLLIFAAVFLIVALVLSSVSITHAMKDIMFLVEQINEKECLVSDAKLSKWTELRKIQDRIFCLNRQIYEMNRDKYESQLMQKKLEIENLNLKINPHLLYNSLSAIKMTAFRKNDYETESVVDLLVDYYRLMLNKGEEKIMLGQELAYLEKYIKINEISKKIHYEVEIDISSDAYDVVIPHLILQPIVENSIFHGLNPTISDPFIGFKATYKNDILCIKIIDNGIGIDSERLEDINNKKAIGYGLKNVFFRLNFYYGEKYSLKFESNPSGGTCVTLEIENVEILSD